ncbi:MAG: C39 family peptidase [Planctomycetota bacterium]|jgi:hypothetical protein
MKKCLVFLYTIVVFSSSLNASDKSNMIKNVKYSPMLDGYCAMTCLDMVLQFYGTEVDRSLLLNLGWNYGFFLQQSPYYIGAYPCTEPISEISHASKLLGFTPQILNHTSLEEAKGTIKTYIPQKKPIIIQTISHTMLVIGFENDAEILVVHDPGKLKPDLVPSEDIEWYPLGRGENAKYKSSELLNLPYLWQYRQFQMLIITPDTKQQNIDWKVIYKRNAHKTLGIGSEAYLNFSGIKGIKTLNSGIKNHFGQEAQAFKSTMQHLKWMFELGVGFRRNASTFLSGQAVGHILQVSYY